MKTCLSLYKTGPPVKLGNKYGYIDKCGNVAIGFKFQYADSFVDGIAIAQLNGKSGWIDYSGSTIIDFRFSLTHRFSEGLAAVGMNNKLRNL